MPRPTIFGGRLLAAVALPGALVVSAGFVAATSYSVFSATTSSTGNAFSTGSVVLKNDSSGTQSVSGSALFSVSGITPTSGAVTRCVTVQSTGSLASAVKLYAQNATATNGLAGYLTVKVETGTATGTASGACTGFSPTATISATAPLSSFTSSATSYANGVATGWSPTGTGTETRAFRFTVTPDSSMTNTQQNGSASVDFVWEADNT